MGAGGVSILNRLLKTIALPAVDVAVMVGGMYYLKLYWEHNHRFVQGGHYPSEFMQVAVPAYVAVWLTTVFFSGGYDKPAKSLNLLRGLAIGTLIILALYGLLSEAYRFSRALILLGAVWGAIALPAWRWLFQLATKKTILADAKTQKRRVIIGSKSEFARIESLLNQSGTKAGFTGWINASESSHAEALGSIHQLLEIMQIYRLDEVIFCAKDLSAQEIMQHMSLLQPLKVEIKIAPPESLFVIGSNSINTQGEWYTVQVNTIALPANRRVKRLLDFSFGIVFLALSPLLFWLQKKPINFIKNCLEAILGLKTWVGYNPQGQPENLPKLKPGVLYANAYNTSIADAQTLARINFLYAKEYRPATDVEIIFKNLRGLGG